MNTKNMTTGDQAPSGVDIADAAPDAGHAPDPGNAGEQAVTDAAPPARRRGPATAAGTVLRAPARAIGRFRAAVDHRPARVLSALSALVVLAGVVAGGVWWTQHRSVARQQAGEAAVVAAKANVAGLLTYDAGSVGSLVDRMAPNLTDGFRTDYSTLITQVIVPEVTKQQVSTKADVVATSVIPEESTSDRVVALVFVNQTTKAGPDGAPQVGGSRVRVVNDKVDGRWLVSDMKPI